MRRSNVKVLSLAGSLAAVGCLICGCGSQATRYVATSSGAQPLAQASGSPGDPIVRGAAHRRGVWAARQNRLTYKNHAGQDIQAPLPVGVTGEDVADAEVTDKDALWLATTASNSEIVAYSQAPGGAWQATKLALQWKVTAPVPPPTSLNFLDSPPGVIALAASSMMGHASGVSDLFISQDGGKTFSTISYPDRTNVNLPWSSMILTSTSRAVLVAGVVQNLVFETIDGGKTWSPQTPNGLPTGYTELSMGSPIEIGPKLFVPAFSDGSSGGQFLTLLEDSSQASLTAGKLPSLRLNSEFQAGTLPVSGFGDQIWVISADGATLFKGSLGTGGWTSTPITGLPDTMSTLTVADTMHADAIGSLSTCRAGQKGQTNCAAVIVHYSTSDGGLSWTAQS